MVIVPVRDDALELGATVKITVPFPVPVAPDVTVIHGVLLTATQVQPAPAVTITLPPDPPLETLADVGLMEKPQAPMKT